MEHLEQLRTVLQAIAGALDGPRNPFGKLLPVRDRLKQLRQLALVYRVPGASDTVEQARFVALAALAHSNPDYPKNTRIEIRYGTANTGQETTCTLRDFIRANCDALPADEVDAIVSHVACGQAYRGGGGAAAVFYVQRAKAEG
jgi:hypothetical protein